MTEQDKGAVYLLIPKDEVLSTLGMGWEEAELHALEINAEAAKLAPELVQPVAITKDGILVERSFQDALRALGRKDGNE